MKLNKRFVQRVGSKYSILKDIFKSIFKYTKQPFNKIFIDLFGGGGSVSANATLFFKKVIYNEIDKGIYELFIGIQDDYLIKRLKKRWVSRKEFEKIKARGYKNIEENLILTIWSFGNNRKDYIYGKNIERRKELTFRIINSETEEEYKKWIKLYNEEKVATFEKYGGKWTCFLPDDDWEEFRRAENRRYYKFGRRAKYYRKFYKPFDLDLLIKERGKYKSKQDKQLIEDIKKTQNLERLERLQGLGKLERLQSLERLESIKTDKIELYNLDYREVKLPKPEECIIYLDPPYRGTGGYETEFDFDEFDKRVMSLKEKGYIIFISEYNLPYGEVIWRRKKRAFKSQSTDKFTGDEKLYLVKK